MLTNKVALVTGGARGIGAAIARAMAAQGARVALLDLDGAEAEKTAAGLPTPAMALACDVAVEAEVGTAVHAMVERLGGLDILVNNAGVGREEGRELGKQDPGRPRRPLPQREVPELVRVGHVDRSSGRRARLRADMLAPIAR